jgi:3-hydroxypropionate dehydrogenase (NADP+)
MTAGQVKVAVVGMGEAGRGWAALCVAAGWPVALYDNEAQSVHDAPGEVAARARSLIALQRASSDDVENGIASLQVGRSLLQACGDATWVIEAVREDLRVKQKVFESIESVASKARIVSSSSAGLAAKDIAARCFRQERCLVAHPIYPVELMPLVELAPSPHTEGTLVELLKGWLRALGRIPVTINKHVPGNVADRIAAAVWREAIDLVLSGVIDVDDLDRAVSLGPALGWAAGGPHLSYSLASGKHGLEGFLQKILHTYEATWADLATWSSLEPDQQHKLVNAIDKAYRESIVKIRPARDRRLSGILRGLEQSKQSQSGKPIGLPNDGENSHEP